MSIFAFTVNNVNMLPYIAEDGLKWTRFDVEAPDTGRTPDGVMHRGRVAVRIRLDFTGGAGRPHHRSSTSPILKTVPGKTARSSSSNWRMA